MPISTRVLGVHGIGNRKPGRTAVQAAGQIRAAWSAALARGGGVDGLDLRCVYYADRLMIPMPQGEDELDRLPTGGIGLIQAWAEELGVPMGEVAIQGPATFPIRVLVDQMAERTNWGARVVREIVGLFIREVHAYLGGSEPLARQQSRQAVIDELRAFRPQAMIAHSLGSVVAYEALWEASDVELDLLITLGSPLGMNEVVYQRLSPAQLEPKGQRPPGVKNWVNIADTGDIVAIPIDFWKRFTPDEHLPTRIAPFDCHTARSYLADPATINALRKVG